MRTKTRLSACGVSRRDMLRIGAGGLGFGLFGGIGPVPYVFSKASEVVAQAASNKILVVFEWFGGNDGQREGRAEDRRPLRLAEIDARHEEPVRRG